MFWICEEKLEVKGEDSHRVKKMKIKIIQHFFKEDILPYDL